MGFIEETGAAQHMRDSRIAAIYEGANGIHGIDLVQRKLPLANGETVARRDRRHPPGGERRRGARRGRLWRDGGAARRGFGRARGIDASDAGLGSRPIRIPPSRARRPIFACSGSRSAARAWPKRASPPRRLPKAATEASSGASASPASLPRNWRSPRRDWRAPSRRAARRSNPMRRSWRTAHDPNIEDQRHRGRAARAR